MNDEGNRPIRSFIRIIPEVEIGGYELGLTDDIDYNQKQPPQVEDNRR